MCDPITIAVGGAILGAAGSAYTGMQQARATRRASAQATAASEKQAKAAEEDTNRRNAKQPNTAALLASNQQAGQSGQSGTMLTGPAGIDPSMLLLGKNTLLGV